MGALQTNQTYQGGHQITVSTSDVLDCHLTPFAEHDLVGVWPSTHWMQSTVLRFRDEHARKVRKGRRHNV
jgi:hypothetical protein